MRECGRKADARCFCAATAAAPATPRHLANDFLYPLSKTKGSKIGAHALTENPAVLTCIANDEGLRQHFLPARRARQQGRLAAGIPGGGNSPNILRALEEAKRIGMKATPSSATPAARICCLAEVPDPLPIDDMQIAEDTQTIVCHMIIQVALRAA